MDGTFRMIQRGLWKVQLLPVGTDSTVNNQLQISLGWKSQEFRTEEEPNDIIDRNSLELFLNYR